MNKLIHGNSLEKLKELEDNSVDAVITDPPYELGFMGKKWDASGIAYNVELWQECLRVLKPGGHLIAFGGTRTYHRMAVAIEDAGFEVRDMLEWIYASGFPKSLNVGKKVDQLQGNEREVVGKYQRPDGTDRNYDNWESNNKISIVQNKAPATAECRISTKGNSEWEGFGTALKPAHEPIIMARKPLSEKTIVENVLKHGTGAIDIDGCRIPTSEDVRVGFMKTNREKGLQSTSYGGEKDKRMEDWEGIQGGRFPANIICTDDALNDGVMTKTNSGGFSTVGGMFGSGNKTKTICSLGDSGSKSRYFDIECWAEKHGLLQFPKASKRERNEGCEGLEEKNAPQLKNVSKFCDECGKREDYKCNCNTTFTYKEQPNYQKLTKNHHPTVKPVHLMSWLVRLVSKEGDVVLDPFMGSGSTGVACKKLNRQFIGIEMTEEYIPIAEARIKAVKKTLL